MSHPIIRGQRMIVPSKIQPGDVISATSEQGFHDLKLMVDSIEPTTIRYGSSMVPVWWIKGTGMGTGMTEGWIGGSVRTVCIPGQQWYLHSRRST
jgi:hypothetical protein